MKIRSKKAMTLIELIIVIGILAVVMGATSIFFLSNYKSLNNAEDKADLQHAAQSVINELSQAALNSKSYTNPSKGEFVFTNNIFKLKDNEFKEGSRLIASNIKSIDIEAIGSNEGIDVKVTAGLGGKTETIETKLYFRKVLPYNVKNGDEGDASDEDAIVPNYDQWVKNKEYPIGAYVKYAGFNYKSILAISKKNPYAKHTTSNISLYWEKIN